MANVFRIILFSPLRWIYGLILWIRHKFYDLGIFEEYIPPVPVLCIGNLELGGSGKTPMADFLISKLSTRYKTAYLSRGYKRQSEGFRLASENDSVETLGDEAFQVYSKWKGNLTLAVDADRKNGIEEILKRHPETNLILLDDAMQHRKVKAGFNLLLTPFYKPFYRNFLVPSGSLRDIPSAYRRARAVVFTKGEKANAETLAEKEREWQKTGLDPRPLFVSSIRYGKAVNSSGKLLEPGTEVVCVAGLASNRLFFDHCWQNFPVKKFISKPDHSRYLGDFFSRENLENKILLTTEKDFHKLVSIAPHPEKIFFLPIEIQIFPEQSFLETIEKGL